MISQIIRPENPCKSLFCKENPNPSGGVFWWFLSTFAASGGECNPKRLKKYFEIYGKTYKKWLGLGELSFGVPCTDETSMLDGVGRFNHLNNNSASIDLGPATCWHRSSAEAIPYTSYEV